MYNVVGMQVIKGNGVGFSLKRSANKGFSLIELLVSIGLMAVLTAGLVSMIGRGSQQYGRDSRRQADLEKAASALELARSESIRGSYPPCSPVGAGCVLTAVGNTVIVGGTNIAFSTYLGTGGAPVDPLGASRQYIYRPFDSTNGTCDGSVGDRCVTYSLCAGLEKNTTAVSGSPACGSCGTGITCSFRLINP